MLRLDEASKLLLPEILELEQASDLPPSRVGDHETARRGESLQTGRSVRRLADDAALLRCALADQIADNDEPRGDADAHGQALRGTPAAPRRR